MSLEPLFAIIHHFLPANMTGFIVLIISKDSTLEVKKMSPVINFLKNNSTFKLIVILFLILIMLIPLTMVEDLIYERTAMKQSAENTIAQSWGSDQIISGPILKIPYKIRIVEKKLLKDGQEKEVIRFEQHYVFLLSDQLDIETSMASETRYLGIYDVPVYLSESTIRANFNNESLSRINEDYGYIQWEQAKIIVPFTDVRGIRELNAYEVGNDANQTLNFTPYQKNNVLSGIVTDFPVKFPTLTDQSKNIDLVFKLSLAGSNAMMFRPFGRKTNVSMSADWNSPGFNGMFLPAERDISATGFTASWQVLELNRNFPQLWHDSAVNEHNMAQAIFGVKLYQPVNLYQQNKRSIKYAVLFITLTFMTFFLFELLYKKRLHPMHYFFTGGTLSTFYLLLLAFSEHTGFTIAYIIATISVSLLMGSYSISLFKSRIRGYLVGLMCIVLYSFFYILIQSEENALLLGAIAFFAILAIIMYSTRNINWYQSENSQTIGETANS
ncbi:MAG: cell envelope integrity protein CreD [Gammaproteobacteria bacterium]|nr:cell envelope integrity protein CreD [Gammaproteobacteria bacterium]